MKRSLMLAMFWGMCLQADILYLDDLLKEALSNSPDIVVTKADYEAARQRSIQANTKYLPSLDLSAYAGTQSVDYADQDLGTPPSSVKPGTIDTDLLAAKVNARQLVYDFGKTGGYTAYYARQSDAAESIMQQNISNKIYQIKKSYYELLMQHALLEVRNEDVRLNEQQLYRSQRYFEAGIRTKVDVTDAEVNLIESQISLQDTQYAIKSALSTLYTQVGMDLDDAKDDIYVQKPELENAYASLSKPQQDEHYYREQAYANRSELQAYEANIQAAQAKKEQITGDYLPSVYLNGEYLAQEVDEDAFAPEQQWKATMTLEWNLYAGNKTSAQSEEADLGIIKAEADLAAAKLRVQKEVNDAYINVHKGLDNVKLSESLSIASKQKFLQAQKRYEHGLADFIELQESRQSYIDALAMLAQEYYRYYIALAQLDRAIGI